MATFAWADATGQVHVTTVADGADSSAVISILIQDGHMPPGAEIVSTPTLPSDKRDRHKWRIQGGQVRVDLTVPDLPHPRQALLDQVDAATTVAQLKAILRTVVDRG